MFGIGAQELILLMVMALIIFGPQRLPEIAAQVGKAIRDFRRMSDDLTGEFQRSLSLDEPPKPPADPVLTGETIPPSVTPDGVSDAIAGSLRVETIPTEPAPGEVGPATADLPWTNGGAAVAEETLVTVATKADPLAGVSLLDEPEPYVGETSRPEPEPEPEPVASYVYEPSPLAENGPLALDGEPMPSGEADAVRATNPIADAWAATITTEATGAVAVAEPATDEAIPEGGAYAPGTYAVETPPYAPPKRERIDPNAEVTIREKIEAQVAAEAFRERRRIAGYSRQRKRG
jgi:Tat protein translocase TatB subunit